MDFPIDPVLGQEHFAANQSWTWDGTTWVANNSRDTQALRGYPVDFLSPVAGEVLRYNGTTWVNAAPEINALAIAGVSVQVNSLDPDDLLRYNGSAWVNVPQTEVVFGGNY
jgi:hypothetical protein